MGVNFKDLIPKTPVKLDDLGGKVIAIDAYNTIYQFLSIIRQPDGTPLKNSKDEITSHLSGLLYRTTNLVEMGIKPVYVFDGKAPELKAKEVERRHQIKAEATVKYAEAKKVGDTAKMRQFAQMTATMKPYMVPESKKLLDLMGLPWIQAPSEGEAQAAHMNRVGEADYCASQDYDSLLFGAPKLLRNVTISGRRRRGKAFIEVVPEVVELKEALGECELSLEQLIDVGILIGTDFNPNGIEGVGPKTALKLIKTHGCIEKAIPFMKTPPTFPCDPQLIREEFLHPKVTDDYVLEWKAPSEAGLIEFMSSEKEFGEERVRKTVERMTAGTKKAKGKVSLEKWFG